MPKPVIKLICLFLKGYKNETKFPKILGLIVNINTNFGLTLKYKKNILINNFKFDKTFVDFLSKYIGMNSYEFLFKKSFIKLSLGHEIIILYFFLLIFLIKSSLKFTIFHPELAKKSILFILFKIDNYHMESKHN